MDASSRSSELDPKYLLGQLNTARKEINNLRQQVKNLRYIHEKDVDGIKHAIRSYVDGETGAAESSLRTIGARPSTSTQADDTLNLKPIGLINTGFPSKRATPRQPGVCKTAPGKVTLFNSTFTNPEHALTGLQDFSHMWILFHFHRNDSTHVRAKVAPPRLNGARIGVFSTRSPHRPCPIGLSLVKIVRIEGSAIHFEGVDMVDETPVLDIKPYIPQYDNPLHIEKMLVRPNDEISNIRRITDGNSRLSDDFTDSRVRDAERENFIFIDEIFNTDESRRRISRENNHSSSADVAIAARPPNISRDEEIAMRLQAEEFETSPNFDNYRTSNYFITNSRNDETIFNSYDSIDTIENDNLRVTTTTTTTTTTSSILSNYTENIGVSVDTGENLELFPNVRNFLTTGNDEITRDTIISRNSRLLDGADGPRTVCGTDLDLSNRRRSLSGRNDDNSPIRMGIREAPDGEEGLESQMLTPSQTIANMQIIATAPSTNITDTTSQSGASLVRGLESFRNENTYEIRVPDWISRPRTVELSVVFNERALAQLSDIHDDEKADEEKFAIESVLREDPRSVYLRQRWGNQFYTFLINDLHISCRFDDNRGIVTVFQIRHAGRTCECGEPEWQCLGHTPLS